MKNRLMTWSFRLLAVLTICFLSGCYDGHYWWHDRDRDDDRGRHEDRDRHDDRDRHEDHDRH